MILKKNSNFFTLLIKKRLYVPVLCNYVVQKGCFLLFPSVAAGTIGSSFLWVPPVTSWVLRRHPCLHTVLTSRVLPLLFSTAVVVITPGWPEYCELVRGWSLSLPLIGLYLILSSVILVVTTGSYHTFLWGEKGENQASCDLYPWHSFVFIYFPTVQF